MPITSDTFFLLFNASLLWGVIAGVLTWVFRSKMLVIVLLIAPFIIGGTFRDTPGMPELIGFYGTSLVYGAIGIVLGMVYADYQRMKSYLATVSKSSFLARIGIGLSSIYLLGFFGQKIIFDNPMVRFALDFIEGGSRAKELVRTLDYDGAVTAGGVIVASFAVLGINSYRHHRRAVKAAAALPAERNP